VSRIQDPAIRSYFFGKGYVDLRAVIVDTWRRNLASAQKELAAMRGLWPRSWTGKGLSLVRGAAAVSVLIFGTGFFLIASVLHVALLMTLFLLVYLGFTLVYLIERAYLTWKGFFRRLSILPLQEFTG
jgi:transcriptional regulator of nitric oxide reductase